MPFYTQICISTYKFCVLRDPKHDNIKFLSGIVSCRVCSRFLVIIICHKIFSYEPVIFRYHALTLSNMWLGAARLVLFIHFSFSVFLHVEEEKNCKKIYFLFIFFSFRLFFLSCSAKKKNTKQKNCNALPKSSIFVICRMPHKCLIYTYHHEEKMHSNVINITIRNFISFFFLAVYIHMGDSFYRKSSVIN